MQIDQSLIDQIVNQAITGCSEKVFAGDTRRLRQSLLQGHCEHCLCVSESLARQIGGYLGSLDKTVKAVYRYGPVVVESGDIITSKENTNMNLVVWVERKSAALSALLETLEAELTANLSKLGCSEATTHCLMLNVEVISDQDVNKLRGLGLFVHHANLVSLPVWEREDRVDRPIPAVEKEPVQAQFDIPELFDPELMPEPRLLEHALSIERIQPENRTNLEHHLTELKVILIRRLISDQLAYITIAKRWFHVTDLAEIQNRKIGLGRIGGKAAGMLLAANILKEMGDDTLRKSVQIPESFFLGSDVMYIFMAMNGLQYWSNEKYKPDEQIWQDYPKIKQEFEAGSFPPEILYELKSLLKTVGDNPLIVRSSSQLEDSFGTAFAGKYDSHFCPNQGNLDENLKALTLAIARTYASTFKPEALLYRRSKGLQDYDERMAILIQIVQGSRYGRYYLPQGAGVAFSRNLYRWSPQIRREDGFARLVWGLGTRAVERVGNDYPHPVALSHPTLQPDDSLEALTYYSQQYVDLIDMQENVFKTLPVSEVLKPDYPALRFIAQLEQDGSLVTPRRRVMENEISSLIITFDELLRRSPFAKLLSRMLRILEEHYHNAVDVEFTVSVPDLLSSPPEAQITLLQCRPQSYLKTTTPARIPTELERDDLVFTTCFMVPQGFLSNIRHVIFVEPEKYYALDSDRSRKALGGLIGQLNQILTPKTFICVGPGRWGSLNTDLGVYVCYSDVCNTGALVEVSGKGIGLAPEPSLGTHFFQDLMEAQIYPLAINLDEANTIFNRNFFYNTPNRLNEMLHCDERYYQTLKLIAVEDFRPGHHIDLTMDDEAGLAAAYISPE
jgi:hypothetical protein